METCENLAKSKHFSGSHLLELSIHLGSIFVVAFFLLANMASFAYCATMPLETMLKVKHNSLSGATNSAFEDGFADYQTGNQFQEYPIIVPKRAALILDRILKEIETVKDSNQLINDWSPISRRGNNKDKLYFRCYFNAVSCYRRK